MGGGESPGGIPLHPYHLTWGSGSVPQAISVRLDDEAPRALIRLESTGLNRSAPEELWGVDAAPMTVLGLR